MDWFEVVGWTGSVLVVVSLMQARVLRFRVLNLVGSVIAAAYNVAIGVWPFVAMNGAIAVINVYWLVRLLRERHDAHAYAVVEVATDDAYLAHVLAVHADDVARFRPAPAPGSGAGSVTGPSGGPDAPRGTATDARTAAGAPTTAGAGTTVDAGAAADAGATAAPLVASDAAFLVVRGDETVGVVLVSHEGDGVGRVDLDWVTPRFRDFTPGEFVYARSGVFAAHGLRRLVTNPARPDREYLERVGFRPGAAGWERDVAPVAA